MTEFPAGERKDALTARGEREFARKADRAVVLLLGLVLSGAASWSQAGVSDGWLLKLAGFPSRYVGSPGHRATLDEVERAFRAFGLAGVRRERFTVTAPVEESAEITGPGLGRVVVHAVWPNHVQPSATPRAGFTGPLLDAGSGEPSALDGTDPKGAIALVRLPCAEGPLGWTTPFVLGAAAVVFLPPAGRDFTREEAEQLFLNVAADLPRFWAPPASARVLLDAARRRARVTLRARVGWKEIATENVIGELPGAGGSEGAGKAKRVVLQAYTDAQSVVPSLAPGAEEAGGLACLLELAGHFAVNRPPPSLLFLATSGHGHVLSGSHEFLARHMRRDKYFSRSITAGEALTANYFIGLDLTSGDGRVATFAQGTFYQAWETNLLAQNALAGPARLLDAHAERLWGKGAPARYLNGVSPPTRTWKDLLGFHAAFDAEAATVTGTPGLTFATPFDARMRVDTPLDTPDGVNRAALDRQIETVRALLSAAFADPAFFAEMKLELPDTGRALNGEVHEFERTVTGLPSKPVAGALLTARSGWGERKTYGPVRGLHAWMSRADDPATLTVTETGSFRVPIMRLREWWRWVGCTVEGYAFDADGRIMMAPDAGPITGGQFPTGVAFQEREKGTLQVLFRGRSLTFLEPVDPRQLRFLDTLTVLDGLDQPFMNFGLQIMGGQSTAQEAFTPAVVVFAPPAEGPAGRVKAILSRGAFGVRGIFTGADEGLLAAALSGHPEGLDGLASQGAGYPVAAGVVRRGPFEGAKDMWVIDEGRGRALMRYHVRNQRLEGLHREAGEALAAARRAWAAKRYGTFLSESRRAWGLEARAYPEFNATANDLVRTVVFYCLLLMPFAFCMERLLFAFATLKKQLLAVGGIFLAGFLALRQVHPAFQISSNPVIIFLAFIILALGLIVLAIIVSKFQRELRRMKGERGDYEAVDVGRVSATVAALVLGLSNLRRRPLRTALTVGTVIVLTFTVLSLVSMSSTIGFFRLPRGDRPPYAGALVRENEWQVLQPPVIAYLTSALEGSAHVVPRSWVTARRRDEPLQLEVTGPEGRVAVVAGLLGLSADESHVLKPAERAGLKGRWFTEADREVCLLPRSVADRLGTGPGGSVRIRGLALTVVGTFDGAKLDALKDLDGEAVTPGKFEVKRSRYDWEKEEEPKLANSPAEGMREAKHLAGDQVVVVPHGLSMALEGRLRSVAVVPRGGVPPADLLARVKEFLVRSAVLALVSDGRQVHLLTSIGAVSVSGTTDLLLPIVLVGLIVLNTMMGSVHERIREIGIFGSVGLAPSHIGALFVAESFVVAIVGTVLGYLVAQVVAAVLLSGGGMAGLSLNYSSSAAVGAVMIVIAAVLGSALYPARRASNLSVPDVTRRWVLPPAKGDVLQFEFPFTVGDVDLVGLFTYLADLFRAFKDSSIGSFAADDVTLRRKRDGMVIAMTCWLAPYDLGISQRVTFETSPMNVGGLHRIHVTLERRSGEAGAWHRQNRRFLSALRKRFLVWRMFGPEQKDHYTLRGHALSVEPLDSKTAGKSRPADDRSGPSPRAAEGPAGA